MLFMVATMSDMLHFKIVGNLLIDMFGSNSSKALPSSCSTCSALRHVEPQINKILRIVSKKIIIAVRHVRTCGMSNHR
jgi:hypothetical protein